MNKSLIKYFKNSKINIIAIIIGGLLGIVTDTSYLFVYGPAALTLYCGIGTFFISITGSNKWKNWIKYFLISYNVLFICSNIGYLPHIYILILFSFICAIICIIVGLFGNKFKIIIISLLNKIIFKKKFLF